ncbi:MAG TPA: amino acid adenylation domain-containing protein, partial [Thermoanaerobaculia bacterium]|nr:amino acid adenylation domain-containing protein [Thermoanaerobaculia bacterium]
MGPEVPVALFLERSVEAVVALVGVLAAGGAYVPLDPTYPSEWVSWVLKDSRAPVVVTTSSLAGRLPADTPTLLLEEVAESPTTFDRTAGPDHPAYLIYTSGSTGRPKGVVVRHGSLMNLTRALRETVYRDEAGPLRVAVNASFAFDGSVKQIVQLAWGHCLHILPQDVRLDPDAMVETVRRQRLDVLDCTPSQLRPLLQAGLGERDAAPAMVLVGGEAVDAELRDLALTRTRTRFWNLYGPTECTVDTVAAPFAVGTPPSCIGLPLSNVRVYVADSPEDLAPLGVPGELQVGGAGLARGYLGRPDLTAERFIPDSFGGGAGERLYRTGDLVRWLPNGSLDFLGRLDDQVKIRGFRIELGEIEAVLAALPEVREALVVTREDTPGLRRLVAYVVGEAATETLRQALRERLPEHMVPAAFVTLPQLPLTPNGKVDRKALPPPEPERAEESWLAPRTPVEEVLAAIWAELLGLERVGAADSFFDLGGHSLLATRVMSRLRSAFGVEMPLRDLFEAPLLADLAARVEVALRAGTGHLTPSLLPLSPEPRQGPLPLSFAQQRLWFIDQLEPGSPLYNMPVTLRVEGPLDPAALASCLGEIVRRHEALRTVFTTLDDSPVQTVRPAALFVLPVVDLSGLPEGEREARALALAAEEAALPFDLTRGPLLRGVLLRLAGDDHIAALTMHHIASDGWSMGILVRETSALYAAFSEGRPSPLPELPLQYADFSAWQRSWLHGAILESEITFWRRQLAGLPPRLELPTDRPRPAMQSFRGALRPVRLPADLTRQVQVVSRREGATLFMGLLAALQSLLARYSGQQDLAVGSPVAGRNRLEIEGLIGFFVNTLVLRGDLTGEPSFHTLLGRVRETALAAHMHQDVPFEKLVEELAPERSLAQTPLFQVLFVLQNVPVQSLEARDLRLRPVRGTGITSKFDLTLNLREFDGELIGMVEHATDLFDT